MKKYKVCVDGCDDSTSIEIELTDEQAETVRNVAERITEASTYGCMPKMSIDEVKADE